jgi:PEP-CTERM motif
MGTIFMKGLAALLLAGIASVGMLASGTAASAKQVVIDFENLPNFQSYTLPLEYPDAEFASSTGELLVVGYPFSKEICPFDRAAGGCNATLFMSIYAYANNFTFTTSGDQDPAAGVYLTLVTRTGNYDVALSFDGDVLTTDFHDLSAYRDIIALSFFSNDAGGVGYDNFRYSDLPYTPPAVVPEPASWAMLIAGFGLSGAVMRRRRGLRVWNKVSNGERAGQLLLPAGRLRTAGFRQR